MYRPGDGGGGETPPSPPPPQYSRHAISGEGLVEKSVSTGTTAMTGVVGGRSGSSRCRLPCTSNATGTSWSAIAVTTSTLARSEVHTSDLQSRFDLVCRLLLEKKKK